MPNINPVDLQTLGARVTDPAQLTKGRWYAVRTNCEGTHKPLVHAKYTGMVGSFTHEFEVCAEDYRPLNRSLGLAKHIHRDGNSIRTGKLPMDGVCEVFKFKQVNLAPVSPTGRRLTNDWPAIPSVPKAANQSNTSAPAATLSPIDQIKSEIDVLNAQKQIKQEEIDKLTKDVATIGGEVDKLKQKVADSLKDYLPEPKKANLVDWPIPNRKMQEWMEQYHSQREELTPVHLDDLIKRINHEIFTVYAVNYGAHTVRSGNIISSAEGIRGLSELTALRDYYIHLRGQLRWEAQRRVLRSIRPI